MFVLLEHSCENDVHWDLAVEVPGQARLATWRLLTDPRTAAGAISAEPIADHDPRFLDYEGPLRRAAGSVERIDRGQAVISQHARGTLRAQFDGAVLRGTYEIITDRAGGACLRRVDSDA